MKSQNKKLRKSRGVSPVIATVILVAVTITVAVAVSYWMSGIASQYTSFEKVEIQSGYATITSGKGWTIHLTLKNTGSETATLINVFVNDAPVTGEPVGDVTKTIEPHKMTVIDNCQTDATMGSEAYAATGTNLLADPRKDVIESGDSSTLEIYIGYDYGELTSGTTVNIKIHSAGGMDYIKLVQLV